MFARLKAARRRRSDRSPVEQRIKDQHSQSSSSLLLYGACCRQYHLENSRVNFHSLDTLNSPSSDSSSAFSFSYGTPSSLSSSSSEAFGSFFRSSLLSVSDSMAGVTSSSPSRVHSSPTHLSSALNIVSSIPAVGPQIESEPADNANISWALVGVTETLWLEAKNGSLCLAPCYFTNVSQVEISQQTTITKTSEATNKSLLASTESAYNRHDTGQVNMSQACQQTHQLPPTVIVFANGAFHLKDLSPSHQTQINDRRVPARAFVKLNEFDQVRFGENSPVYRFEKFITKRPSSGDSGMDSLKHQHHTLNSSYTHHLQHHPCHVPVPNAHQSPSSSSLLSSSSSQSSSTSSGNSSIHSSPSKVLKLAMQRMKRKLSQFSARNRHDTMDIDSSLVDGSVDITFIRYEHAPVTVPLPLSADLKELPAQHPLPANHQHHSVRREPCPLPDDCDIYHSVNRSQAPIENEYDLVAPDEDEDGVEDDDDDDDDDEDDDDEDIVLDSLDCYVIDNAVTNSGTVLPTIMTQCRASDPKWCEQTLDIEHSHSSIDAPNTRRMTITPTPSLAPSMMIQTEAQCRQTPPTYYTSTAKSFEATKQQNHQSSTARASGTSSSTIKSAVADNNNSTFYHQNHQTVLENQNDTEQLYNLKSSIISLESALETAKISPIEKLSPRTTAKSSSASFSSSASQLPTPSRPSAPSSSSSSPPFDLQSRCENIAIESSTIVANNNNNNNNNNSESLYSSTESAPTITVIHNQRPDAEPLMSKGFLCNSVLDSDTINNTGQQTASIVGNQQQQHHHHHHHQHQQHMQRKRQCDILALQTSTKTSSSSSSSSSSSAATTTCKPTNAEAFFISFDSDNDNVQTTMLRMTKDVTVQDDKSNTDNTAIVMSTELSSSITMSHVHRDDSDDVNVNGQAPSGGLAFVISFEDDNDKHKHYASDSGSLSEHFQRQPSLPKRFTTLGRHSFSGNRRTESEYASDSGTNNRHYQHQQQQQQRKTSMSNVHSESSKVSQSKSAATSVRPTMTTAATATTTTTITTGFSASTLKRSSSARAGGHEHEALQQQQQQQQQQLHHHRHHRQQQQLQQQSLYHGNRSHLQHNHDDDAGRHSFSAGTKFTSSPISHRRASASKAEVHLSSSTKVGKSQQQQQQQQQHQHSRPDRTAMDSVSQAGQLSESAVYLINRMLEDNSQHRSCPEESDSSYNSGHFTSVHQHPMSLDYSDYSVPSGSVSAATVGADDIDSGTILVTSSHHDKQTDSAIDDDELSDTGTYTVEIDDDEHKHRRYDRPNRSSSSVTKDDDGDDDDDEEEEEENQIPVTQIKPTRRIDSSTFERKASPSKTTIPEMESNLVSQQQQQQQQQPVSTEEESEELVEDDDEVHGDDEVDEEEEEEEDKLEIARRKIDELFNVFENRQNASAAVAVNSGVKCSPSKVVGTPSPRSGNSSGTFTRPKRRSSFSSNETANNSTSTEDDEAGGTTMANKSTTLSRKAVLTPKSRFQDSPTPPKSVHRQQQQQSTNIKMNDTRIGHETQLLQQQSSKIRAAYSQRAGAISTAPGVKQTLSRVPQPQSQQQSYNRQISVSSSSMAKSQSAPGTPLMSENRKVFRSRLPNLTGTKSITKPGVISGIGNCSRKSSIVSSASSMDDRYSSVEEFDDQSSVLSADTYVMSNAGAQSDSNRSGTPAHGASSNSSMRFNRAFALRRARLGMDTCGVEISEQAAEKAKVSQQKTQPKQQKPKTPVSGFNRQDGGRFSLRATPSSTVSSSKRTPTVAAIMPTRKNSQTAQQSSVSSGCQPKSKIQNYMSSTVSASGKHTKSTTSTNNQLSVMSSNENLANVRHPSPRFGRKKNPTGRLLHSDNEMSGMLDGESSCDENSGFSRFGGRSSLRQNVPYMWSMKNNTQNKPRPQLQPLMHETASVPVIEPLMQKSCTFGLESSFNRSSYETLNDDSGDYNVSPLDGSIRHMSTFQVGKRFFSTKPHQMAQFDRDFRCSSAAPRIKLSTEPNMMTHSATESLLTRHSNTSSASSNGLHGPTTVPVHYEHRSDMTHQQHHHYQHQAQQQQQPSTGPIGVIALSSGTPPINASAINSRVFSISPLDSLVISAINQLSSKLRNRMQDLLERERTNQSLDSDTRALMEEILPRVNSDSGQDRKSASKNSATFTHETNNVSRDLSNILKNLKKAEQIFDVFQLLMDPSQTDSSPTAAPVVEEPETTSESDIIEIPSRPNLSSRKFSAPVLETDNSLAQSSTPGTTGSTVQSGTTTNRKSFFIEI